MLKRHVTRFSLAALLLFLLSAFFVACGSSSTTTKATIVPLTPSPTIALTTYQGTGYSIGYPQGWTLTHGNQEQVQIADAAQSNLAIEAKTGTSTSSSISTSIVQTTLRGLKVIEKNYSAVTIPSKTTINGTTWDQGAATMTDPKTGPMKIVVMSTQNPKHPGQIIILLYGATQKLFDKVNQADFQPMLQSLQFQA